MLLQCWWALFPVHCLVLIGWAAGDESLGTGGWVLFGIQFLWQFPHFWAICWIAYKDYSQAGFKLLPSEKGPTKFTALQTVIYSLLLIADRCGSLFYRNERIDKPDYCNYRLQIYLWYGNV